MMLGQTMRNFFYILANVMIVISLIGQFMLILRLIFGGSNATEVILRTMSLTGGLFVFFAAQSLGITIADLLAEAIGHNALIVGLLGVVLPVLVGTLVTKYFIICMLEDNDVAIRVLIFFGTLLIVMFGDAYATSPENKVRLLPNISFVLSVIIYAILNYKTSEISKYLKKR